MFAKRELKKDVVIEEDLPEHLLFIGTHVDCDDEADSLLLTGMDLRTGCEVILTEFPLRTGFAAAILGGKLA